MALKKIQHDTTVTEIFNGVYNDFLIRGRIREYSGPHTLNLNPARSKEEFLDWYTWTLDKESTKTSEEHLQPKAPEKIPEGWE